MFVPYFTFFIIKFFWICFNCFCFFIFFFFQAEDGIRDVAVTGVQTCALPISYQTTAMEWMRQQKHTSSNPSSRTKEVGKGTGLGLATVYGIVKQSGGFIWVDSEKGRGATFEIYLPSCRKPVSARDGITEADSMPGGSETILLVEDETAVRELASEFLKSSGYKVLEAQDGAEGLRFAMNYPDQIHLLLTDMVMPRMNGVDLAEKIGRASG